MKILGFVLDVIAAIMRFAFSPFLFSYCTVRALWIGGVDEWNRWENDKAVAKDKLSNVTCKYFFNDWMGAGFGNSYHTISYILGKNKRDGTLKPLGYLIAKDLDEIQQNHVEKAFENNN